MKPKLVLVGGFLGSGKTTLLRQLVERLSKRGKTVGTITNDQAPGLVDTALLGCCRCEVKEVAGSCFCCNFHAFEEAVQSLIDLGAEFILAEPVGSCTDLAATIVQPLKQRRPDIDLAPFTVLVSPDHVREAVGEADPAMHPNALYILRLQMAESDRLLLNKIDLLDGAERAELVRLLRSSLPGRDVDEISARAGEGINSWLESTLAGSDAGSHVVHVDYDRYAEGEAVLGWLNAIIQLEATDTDIDFLQPTLTLMEALGREFGERRAPIGHVKAVVESGDEQRTANLTGSGSGITVPDHTPLRGTRARLILNARVQMPAEALEAIARSAIAGISEASMRAFATEFRCLTPGRPRLTYRCTTSGPSTDASQRL